jgi:hypothetical protein
MLQFIGNLVSVKANNAVNAGMEEGGRGPVGISVWEVIRYP